MRRFSPGCVMKRRQSILVEVYLSAACLLFAVPLADPQPVMPIVINAPESSSTPTISELRIFLFRNPRRKNGQSEASAKPLPEIVSVFAIVELCTATGIRLFLVTVIHRKFGVRLGGSGCTRLERLDSARMAPGIAERVRTRSTAPSRIASFGIPKTTQDSSS